LRCASALSDREPTSQLPYPSHTPTSHSTTNERRRGPAGQTGPVPVRRSPDVDRVPASPRIRWHPRGRPV